MQSPPAPRTSAPVFTTKPVVTAAVALCKEEKKEDVEEEDVTTKRKPPMPSYLRKKNLAKFSLSRQVDPRINHLGDTPSLLCLTDKELDEFTDYVEYLVKEGRHGTPFEDDVARPTTAELRGKPLQQQHHHQDGAGAGMARIPVSTIVSGDAMGVLKSVEPALAKCYPRLLQPFAIVSFREDSKLVAELRRSAMEASPTATQLVRGIFATIATEQLFAPRLPLVGREAKYFAGDLGEMKRAEDPAFMEFATAALSIQLTTAFALPASHVLQSILARLSLHDSEYLLCQMLGENCVYLALFRGEDLLASSHLKIGWEKEVSKMKLLEVDSRWKF